ncbi:uncharacterized protein LOC115985177 [Quercus lobata]|uniref:uncharacterized protein LOC115985177 n=1 Tax=Quercus lobata TaxID=97700 RepID=UPI001246058A|nr:uncharacterized protein LOC115985177 [Quercus lobata]
MVYVISISKDQNQFSTFCGSVGQLEMFGRVARDVWCWIIWNQGNFVLHGGILQDPSQLVQRVANLLEEYKEAQGQLAISTHLGSVQLWEPPVGLIYKVNVDVVVFAEINASGIGVVVRNKRGEVMVSLVAKGPLMQDSEEAEVLACQKVLEFVVDASFTDLLLEGDNMSVMKSITSIRSNRSRLGHIYEDIHCIAVGFRSFSVNFVKHSANLVAHSIAKFASNVDDELVWLEESPPPTLEALHFNSHRFNQ